MVQGGRDLLTVAEVAEELGLTVRGVQDRLLRGLMRGERVSPRLWMVPRTEVERWKALGRQRPGRKPKRETT
jgi:excisionase family DNA binding protein